MISNLCEFCKTHSVCALSRTKVCISCGIEQPVPFDMYQQSKICQWNNLSFQTAYSRKKRFGKLFDSVVMGPLEKKDEKMCQHLTKLKIEEIEDILVAIKESGLTDKRYGSIHLFSRLFIPGFCEPTPPKDLYELRKRILFSFETLEFAHLHNMKDRPFFNYRWLLSKILDSVKVSQFKQFIKVIKCKKRRGYYEKMYHELSTTVKGDKLGYVTNGFVNQLLNPGVVTLSALSTQ